MAYEIATIGELGEAAARPCCAACAGSSGRMGDLSTDAKSYGVACAAAVAVGLVVYLLARKL